MTDKFSLIVKLLMANILFTAIVAINSVWFARRFADMSSTVLRFG